MLKLEIKQILWYLIISLFITSCVFGSDNIKFNNNDTSHIFFIINSDVNFYKDQDLTIVQKKMIFFDQFVVLSDEISDKGRLKIKLLDGTEGWIEEKYTSFIPRTWKKLNMLEYYYCYIFTEKKIKYKSDEDEYGKMHYYLNSEIDIAMGVSFLSDYKQNYDLRQFILKREIQGKRDKRFNWNKEFTFGNYKINYIITTDHPEGGISESFDFVKLNEMNLKKCYTVGIDYMPYDSKEKKIMWRKMLFSTLQSLK